MLHHQFPFDFRFPIELIPFLLGRHLDMNSTVDKRRRSRRSSTPDARPKRPAPVFCSCGRRISQETKRKRKDGTHRSASSSDEELAVAVKGAEKAVFSVDFSRYILKLFRAKGFSDAQLTPEAVKYLNQLLVRLLFRICDKAKDMVRSCNRTLLTEFEIQAAFQSIFEGKVAYKALKLASVALITYRSSQEEGDAEA